jgi:hypothetical protein
MATVLLSHGRNQVSGRRASLSRRLLPVLALAALLLAGCAVGTDWRAGQSGSGWRVTEQTVTLVPAADGGSARVLTMHVFMEPPVTAARLEPAIAEIVAYVRSRRYAHASIYFSDTLLPIPVLYNVAAVYFHPEGNNTTNSLQSRPDYSRYRTDMSGIRSHVYDDPHRPRPSDEELIFVMGVHKVRFGGSEALTPDEVRVLEAFLAEKEIEELERIEQEVWIWLLS